jgi:tRNA(adenine34) deaminase
MAQNDQQFLREAVGLAEQAKAEGNLPIGALIVLDGEIVARGRSGIWQPTIALTRHAEMEALCSLPVHLRSRCREMTLYTTLEPCLMCAGAILLHQIGRLVFGATDPNGGVGSCLEALPPYFKHEFARISWEGPALSAECDSLYADSLGLEQAQEDDPDSFFAQISS